MFNPRLTVPIFAVLALVACGGSEPPTFGDRLTDRGSNVQKLGKQWTEGDDLVAQGNKLVAEGQKEAEEAQKDSADAQAKINKGQVMITKGRHLKMNSEALYQQKYPAPVVNQ